MGWFTWLAAWWSVFIRKMPHVYSVRGVCRRSCPLSAFTNQGFPPYVPRLSQCPRVAWLIVTNALSFSSAETGIDRINPLFKKVFDYSRSLNPQVISTCCYQRANGLVCHCCSLCGWAPYFLLQQSVWPSQMLMQAKHVPFGIGLC